MYYVTAHLTLLKIHENKIQMSMAYYMYVLHPFDWKFDFSENANISTI